jgi:pimeloyl-ACP methyl ester carboxylesterase
VSPIAAGQGVDLAYEEYGAGPQVLLLHGLAGDRLTLAPVATEVAAAGAQVIAYSRRGYAGSSAPEPYLGTTVAEQTADAAALLRTLGAAPAIVAGDGFGALIALDLLLRQTDLVRAAVLADPPVYALVPEATRELSDAYEVLRSAVTEGGPEAGVAAWLAGRADDETLARLKASHRAFFADVAGLATLPVTRRELRAITQPVTVLTGPGSSAATIAAADALAALLPNVLRSHDGDLAGATAAQLG